MATVDGMSRLTAKLRRMAPAAKKKLRDALEKSADELLKSQKALAARHRRSGRTINSLRRRDGEHELQIVVGTEYRPARYEEFGTAKTPAIPFFFPAYRLLRKKTKGRMSRAASDAVKEVTRGR